MPEYKCGNCGEKFTAGPPVNSKGVPVRQCPYCFSSSLKLQIKEKRDVPVKESKPETKAAPKGEAVPLPPEPVAFPAVE